MSLSSEPLRVRILLTGYTNEKGNRSNFSAFFVFMDIVFGTYCRPERHPPPHHVGLEGVKTFPGNFFTHLVLPFQRVPAGIQIDEE